MATSREDRFEEQAEGAGVEAASGPAGAACARDPVNNKARKPNTMDRYVMLAPFGRRVPAAFWAAHSKAKIKQHAFKVQPGQEPPLPLQSHPEALGGWCLLRSSKPLSGAGCGIGGGFDSHALPPFGSRVYGSSTL